MTAPAIPSTTPPPLKTGDTVYLNGSLVRWEPKRIVIGKTGRKWAEVVDAWPGTRIDMRTLEYEGNYYYYAYRSKEEWDAMKLAEYERTELGYVWGAFRRIIGHIYGKPKVTSAAIWAALDVLGMTDEAKADPDYVKWQARVAAANEAKP